MQFVGKTMSGLLNIASFNVVHHMNLNKANTFSKLIHLFCLFKILWCNFNRRLYMFYEDGAVQLYFPIQNLKH